jgi:hypothetical protein
MDTCQHCGQQIVFRWIDGRCVPIHPDGGWHCGSWADGGEIGHSFERQHATWAFKDFTRPTRCPECGADVFFIRHNGGSVWVDELGWPWPKHGCFDDEKSTRKFATWSAKASALTDRHLGVVTVIRPDERFAEPVLEVQMGDSTRLNLILNWTPPNRDILGALVVVSLEENVLLHSSPGKIPFHNAVRVGGKIARLAIANKQGYRPKKIAGGLPEPSSVTGRLVAKAEAKRDAIRTWRKKKFFSAGKVLKLGWPMEHFAKMNSLSPQSPETRVAYDSLQAMAERDMERISAAIMKGTVRQHHLFGRFVPLQIACESPTGIECDEIK